MSQVSVFRIELSAVEDDGGLLVVQSVKRRADQGGVLVQIGVPNEGRPRSTALSTLTAYNIVHMGQVFPE